MFILIHLFQFTCPIQLCFPVSLLQSQIYLHHILRQLLRRKWVWYYELSLTLNQMKSFTVWISLWVCCWMFLKTWLIYVTSAPFCFQYVFLDSFMLLCIWICDQIQMNPILYLFALLKFLLYITFVQPVLLLTLDGLVFKKSTYIYIRCMHQFCACLYCSSISCSHQSDNIIDNNVKDCLMWSFLSFLCPSGICLKSVFWVCETKSLQILL